MTRVVFSGIASSRVVAIHAILEEKLRFRCGLT
jgi:hypothetical protein